ncbi:cyclopropane-fatty-acyl-phospholipid synthase family protein [Lentzea sp. NBC_00516]|uniref:cyclopropane-fatty-acyl-phospholipid synthase family protein n=1 Tax=Lentzea sp. NBC_00516 TaxID=2903582 RepID=UPI002E81C96C|nr:cyclopropane-fatty-acyl-phospholipid synthase family protein [Lentzea sp. NBC_00516]WUD29285.1 cyclopropane-fatty-acyl-phospholipid synthase family protein [Lentzea sp. NBC_00516]
MTTEQVISWPGLALPAPAPVRVWLLERLFRWRAAGLPIRIVFPGGETIGCGGPHSPVMRVVRPGALFRRLARVGPIGFGEAYLTGDWTSQDPAGVLTPFAIRLTRPVSRTAVALRRVLDARVPESERNTEQGARRNARYHYDLPAEFFALFLDESLTYSGACFDDTDDLLTAQLNKIGRVLDDAAVGAGTRVLEIGTGWGTLAIMAARRGAEVVSATVSPEQHRVATSRIAAAGLGDRATVLLSDYRELKGTYDAIVSVEMVEAVGAEYWPAYFGCLDHLLAPGGRVALQAITMSHDRMLATMNVHTWIQKYVFPGGQVLSVRAVEEQLARTRLRVLSRRSSGFDYARTLETWRERFLASREEVARFGFDETFARMWEYYLAYAEAGFRAGHLDVWQFSLGR